ncbi:hypothetical protein D027_1943B, partial [Vibrio parahaemolyticus 861]
THHDAFTPSNDGFVVGMD